MRWANGQSGKKEAMQIQCSRSNVFQVKGVPKISAPENTLSMIKIPYRAWIHPDGVRWIIRKQLRASVGQWQLNYKGIVPGRVLHTSVK
jgi:hypothetical protein